MSQTTTKETAEQRFVEHLRELDNGPRAAIRRCLSVSPPSCHLPSYPFIESKIPRWIGSGEDKRPTPDWRRDQFYLVAGLFALVEERKPRKKSGQSNEESTSPKTVTLAHAVRTYNTLNKEKSDQKISGTERRFLTLLDSDPEQLPYRLRQMVQLITRGQNRIEASLDWAQLLSDLRFWSVGDCGVRRRWAKEFYAPDDDDETKT